MTSRKTRKVKRPKTNRLNRHQLSTRKCLENELNGIAAAGPWIHGTNGNDYMVGGSGQDYLNGGDGEDVIIGGADHDALTGGHRDGANDIMIGGAGDDHVIWGATKDGSDVFDGGTGSDLVLIDLELFGYTHSLQNAFESGYLTMTITGDPDFVPTFENHGLLVVPEGASGVITGPTGETITFTGVEFIGKYY